MPQILLVEDKPDIRRLFEIITRDSGYNLVAAEGRDEALKFLEEKHPQLVLVDPILPEWNFFKSSESLEHENIEGSTSTVMFSVVPKHLIDLDLGGKLDKSGLDGYISKLSSNQSIIEEIGRHIN